MRVGAVIKGFNSVVDRLAAREAQSGAGIAEKFSLQILLAWWGRWVPFWFEPIRFQVTAEMKSKIPFGVVISASPAVSILRCKCANSDLFATWQVKVD